MSDDAEMLRSYAANRSEAAFREIVSRHLPLVYGVALRQVGGDAHLAQDVAQRVFVDLARKAHAVCRREVLAGWLYRGTCYAASDAVRAERRRRMREKEAHMRIELSNDDPSPGHLERARSLLDDAIAGLREGDRDAVMLRFFHARPGSIGGQMATSTGHGRWLPK